MATSATLSQEFYTKFQSAKSLDSVQPDIVTWLDKLEGVESGSLSLTSTTNTDATVPSVSAEVSKLRKELNSAALEGYLAGYDMRSFEEQLKQMERRVAVLQTKTNTPGGSGTKKGKFAFRKSANAGESDGRSGTRALPTTKTASPVGPNEGTPLSSTPVLSQTDNNVVFKDRTSAYISRSDLDRERRTGVDLTLTGLERCVVDFVSKAGNEDKSDEGVVMTAVRAENVKSCVLLLGRVRGSVILHGLEGCLVVVECHQLRIHTSKNTRFMLCVGSDAIIEHCEGLEVGRYPSSLPPGLEGTKSVTVLDFSHLRSGPSPNWRSMDEKEEEDVRVELKEWIKHDHNRNQDMVGRLVDSVLR